MRQLVYSLRGGAREAALYRTENAKAFFYEVSFGHPSILMARANGVRGRLKVSTVITAVLMARRSPRSGRSVFTYVSKRRRGR